MAAALLAELERRGALPAEYWILDVSADLRERQRATLAAAVPCVLPRVRWLDALPDAMVPYVRGAIERWRAGVLYGESGWEAARAKAR